MQSKDLRIGNLVYGPLNELSYIGQLGGGTKPNYIEYFSINNDGYGCNGIKPIPLTEDWLIDLGFSKMTDTTPYNYRIHKSKMFFYIRYGTFTTDGGKTDLIGFNGLFIANKFVRVIKYVHELQNLYFALTGEELELKSESKP